MTAVMTRWGVEISPHKPPADEDSIAKLEQEIGVALPDGYRTLLSSSNGGVPQRARFTHSQIHWFFSVGEVSRWRGLMQGRLPHGLVPIAIDPLGNQVCIGLGGAVHGKLYFWDHEREPEKPDWSNVDLIADSFDAFMSGLEPVD